MKYASINNEIISALVNQAYKFPTYEAASRLLNALGKKFIFAKGHEEMLKTGRVKLWVRGYQLTEDEIKAGGLGNFCLATIIKQNDGSCIIKCEKEAVEPANHPMKKRKEARMPNWGHPSLKFIKSGGSYEKYEDAVEVLYNLHQEFPETTIPNKDRLDVMVYSREGKNKPEMKKYRLQVKPMETGAIIEAEEKTAAPKKAEAAEEKEIIGRFTAQAMLKKKKKKPK